MNPQLIDLCLLDYTGRERKGDRKGDMTCLDTPTVQLCGPAAV